MITSADIKNMREELEKYQVPAQKIRSKREARRLNLSDKLIFNINSHWMKGDKYFNLYVSPDLMKGICNV